MITEQPQAQKQPEKNLLTKEDILKGKEKRETLYLEAYGKNVIIRPLTDGELSEVFKLIGPVQLTNEGYIDLNSLDIANNLKALRHIAALALVEPKFSEQEIAEMQFGVPGLIAKRVLEISGLAPGSGEAAKKFRGNA